MTNDTPNTARFVPSTVTELGSVESLTLGSVNGDSQDNLNIVLNGQKAFGTTSPIPTP